MPDRLISTERARNLFEDGYYEENEGLIESLLNISKDEVDKAIEFYANKHPEEKPLTRRQGKDMLDEYKINEREWKQNAKISNEDSNIGSGILSWIVLVIFILVWLCISYGKLLIATYRKAKLVDAADKCNNTPEIEEKCAYYREALRDLKSCPPSMKAIAGTTEFMSVAGVAYLILSIFNFVSYYLQYECGMVAPISLMFGLQIILGFALIARHKLSAGILFALQTLFGVFVMCFDMLVSKIPNRNFGTMWKFNIEGTSAEGIAIIAVFLVVSAAFAIYFISNMKNKVIEILIYTSYIGCYIFAYTNLEIAKRLEIRTQFFTSQGLIFDIPMLAFAWFIILYLMLKGKKGINVNATIHLPKESSSTVPASPKKVASENQKKNVTVSAKKAPKNSKRRTIFLVCILLLLGVVGVLGYSLSNDNKSFDAPSQNIAEKTTSETDNIQSFDSQSETNEDIYNSTEMLEQVESITEQSDSTDELIVTETLSPDEEEKEPLTVSMDAIVSVSATSYLIEEQYHLSHHPVNLYDESLENAWVEAASGNGEGESVSFQFDETYKVSGFNIHAGYQKNADVYEKNSRPATLLVTFSDGTSIDISLKDINEQQQVFFPSTMETSSITLTIQSVYPGSKYEDTVISEIQFF